MQGAGFGYVRVFLNWPQVERMSPTGPIYVFGPQPYDFDDMVATMHQRGVRVLFVLCCAHPMMGKPITDATRGRFAAFAAAAAARFAGKGVLFELWNEPDFPVNTAIPDDAQLSASLSLTIEQYAALASAVVPAMRRADPNVFILGYGATECAHNPQLPYMRALGERGTLELFDAFSLHTYGFEARPEEFEPCFRATRSLLERFVPGRSVPVVNTEVGWSTADRVSEEMQARNLVRTWLVGMSLGMAMNTIYDLREDLYPGALSERENRFGIVRKGLEPKPAYTAAKAFIATLSGFRFFERVACASPTDWIVILRSDTQTAVAAWTTAAPHSTMVGLAAGPMYVVGMLGEERTDTVPTRGLSLTISGSPVYFVRAGNQAVATC